VYSDYPYRREAGELYAEQAFALFLFAVAAHVERLVLLGRLDPVPGRYPYAVPQSVGFAELPHYERLSRPLTAMRGALGAMRRFWRVLDEVDAVWLFGPHPLSLAFAACALVRGRSVALGVRQDMPRYIRERHPGSRGLYAAALALELAWRAAARLSSVVAVGSELGRRYRHARRLHVSHVSLVSEADIAPEEVAAARDWSGQLTALSVGRLDAEKNPAMLADVLARLDSRWRLAVCGEGPMEDALRERLCELGVSDRAELRGYVPLRGGLEEAYRASHAFLHVSWTEGSPQVLLEAFAARLPVVATDVGGVADAAAEAALLVPPGDPEAAARALHRLESDEELRDRLVAAGVERVRAHTIESESAAVAAFLQHRGT
jgi:glycosyltransferase involved in cell wall biosynthesis